MAGYGGNLEKLQGAGTTANAFQMRIPMSWLIAIKHGFRA
jgi:hypothetical protein